VSTALILAAAGSGRRLGLGRPKAVAELAGIPLIKRTVGRFTSVAGIEEAVIVAPPGFVPEFQTALVGLDWPGCQVRVVAGGATRPDSVRCGIESLASNPKIVCIHDGARPFVTQATIEAVLRAAHTHGAATAASRPTDTVREDVEGATSRVLDRSKIWLVETPQAFSYSLVRLAHERARATGVRATDDASLVEACGGAAVVVVPSTGVNLKITHPQDLAIARDLLDD
jgi:2-C-methyl-D-erythritol 4-phosphate cytidylyltransferase